MAKKEARKTVPVNVAPAAATTKTAKAQPAVAVKPISNMMLGIILAVISILVYANTLKNDYALDDYNVVVNNTIIAKGIPAIPEILSTPYRWGNTVSTNDLYRPLSLVVYAVEYQLFGKSTVVNHLTNILVFAGCVLLLFLFFDRLFYKKKTAAAFLAAALFAVHPIHTEVVANIKSLDELLCFFFAFLSMNLFLQYSETGKMSRLATGFLCFVLSFLAKESVVTFVAVTPLVFFFYRNEDRKRSVLITASVVAASAICIAARVAVLNHYNANNPAQLDYMDNIMAAKGLPFDMHIGTAFWVLGMYLKLLLVPYPLICDYSYASVTLVGLGNIVALLSMVIYVGLAGYAVWLLLRKGKDPIAFSILFFLITISLFSNIPFLIGTTMGERLLFFPSAGFCLAAGLLLQAWAGYDKDTRQVVMQPKILGVMLVAVVAYGYMAVNRNTEWQDNETLYGADVKKAPESARLNYYAGAELTGRQATDEKDPVKQQAIRNEGIVYLKKAVDIHPEYADAQASLAEAYYNNNRFDSAEAHARMALKYVPNHEQAFFTLAGAYIAEKKYKEAIGALGDMLRQNPNNEHAQVRLGDAYLSAGLYDSSAVHDKRALELNPKNADAMNNLAGVYFFSKKYQEAVGLYKNALAIRPEFVDAYNNIGACYLYMTKYDSAIQYLERARAINPGNNSTYEIMAVTYNSAGKADSAKKYEVIAQKNNPGFRL